MPKQSLLPVATAINLTDIFSIVQGGVTKQAAVHLLPLATLASSALALKANLADPTFTGTVSGITKTMVGLGNVDNTADTAKPVSTAQQTALDLKATIASPTFTGTVAGITATMVGLGNVTNTSDANKPVSTAQQTALDLKAPIASPTFTGTVAGITKSMVGLGNVDNTTDAGKPISSATQTALDAKLALAGGTMVGNLVLAGDPASALHAATKQYVDSLLGGTGKRTIARVATTGNITIATGLNNGDTQDGVVLADGDIVLVPFQTAEEENGVYVVGAVPARHTDFNTFNEHVGALIVVSEGATLDNTLWIGQSNSGGTLDTDPIVFGEIAIQGALLASNNLSDVPTPATARTNLGLGNVTNTSDANKPVSTAQQTALDLKANLASPTFTGTVSGITATMVGLPNVNNTSDANKPISTATAAALALKAPIASPTFTGTVSGITKTMVGLGNVDNTTDAGKPVSTATQTALDLKGTLAGNNVWTVGNFWDMVNVTYGATVTLDANVANKRRIILGGNVTFANPSNLQDGWSLELKIKQDGTGSRVATWGSKFKFPGGSAVLSTGASDIDVLNCTYCSTDDILLCTLAKDFS